MLSRGCIFIYHKDLERWTSHTIYIRRYSARFYFPSYKQIVTESDYSLPARIKEIVALFQADTTIIVWTVELLSARNSPDEEGSSLSAIREGWSFTVGDSVVAKNI